MIKIKCFILWKTCTVIADGMYKIYPAFRMLGILTSVTLPMTAVLFLYAFLCVDVQRRESYDSASFTL